MPHCALTVRLSASYSITRLSLPRFMTTSSWRGGLPRAIAVPPPHGTTVARAAEQCCNAAPICSLDSGVTTSRGVMPSMRCEPSDSASAVIAAGPSADFRVCVNRSNDVSIAGWLLGLAISAVEEIHEMINLYDGTESRRPGAEL